MLINTIARLATLPDFWRGLAATRRLLAEHRTDEALAEEYEKIAAALFKGESLPMSAQRHLEPMVSRDAP